MPNDDANDQLQYEYVSYSRKFSIFVMSLEKLYFRQQNRAHVRDRGYFSNHHRKVAADISKFSWLYFHFGALHNENNEIKTQ